MIKRIFDILFALAGLLVLAPVLIFTAGAVMLFLGRPVLFTQTRPGLNGKPFRLVKFRTMLNPSSTDNVDNSDEVRLTRFGGLLRSLSLDELPELWNVLKGDMSIVGPRPLLMEYMPLYNEFQSKRHLVRPGITGLAQVNGRNNISWDEKFELDVWYVENHSMWLDIKIIVKTVAKIFMRSGINKDGHATTDYFKGN